MRHLKKGWKLKRTSSHRKALLRNLAISLLEHKKIVTTVAKAKALRPFVEKIITRAKRAVLREKNGQLPEGQKLDVHSRRIVGRLIHNKAVLQELFDTIAPTVLDRPGGYTRIVKLGFRRGDAAELAAIELVDWGAPQDGAVSLKSKKKAASAKKSRKGKEKKETKSKAIEETKPVEQTEEKLSTEQPIAESKEEVPEAQLKEDTNQPVQESENVIDEQSSAPKDVSSEEEGKETSSEDTKKE
ncbi:MAG: 50S ribosomal protein L17 [Ignavibacteria bacterium]|nr:50S ribosomal protein L17 [Ignavibacteria bacterium]